MKTKLSGVWLAGALALLLAAFPVERCDAEDAAIPAGWLAAWKQPAMQDRPLQIVHGIQPRGKSMLETMQFYKDRGLGGIVCNVDFRDYLTSEENWKTLVAGVEACEKLGLVVWLYDEDGYPSGAAGGLVLKRNPKFEAMELVYDPAKPDAFVVRSAYEHTHASNNYHAARRYANLIDRQAVDAFVELTHEAYRQRLGRHFGKTIEAFFTDEPSLIAINLGQIPEDVRKRVRVADPIDPEKKALPSVPWVEDLPSEYQRRYGENLMDRRKSLFGGDSPEDRKVRRQFWSLIADLTADRYFGSLETWCEKHGVASSGHTLAEESLIRHPALEGNALACLARMHIPGLDMLSSNPQAVLGSGWITAALPASAATLTGRRRVMTEISDFSEKMGGRGPADLASMQAAAAWQAAWGVTEFTLYYRPEDRSPEDYRAYGDYVGRLNAVLKPAQIDADVLLYYPIHDLWQEYRPTAEPLNLASQTPRAKALVESFMRLGRTLQGSQVPLCLIDHAFLGKATVQAEQLQIGGRAFKALVLPEGVELPAEAARVVAEFEKQGGRVLRDGPERRSAAKLVEVLQPPLRLTPRSEQIVLGKFRRDGRQVVLLVNVGPEAYRGQLAVDGARKWTALDPASGAVQLLKGNTAAAVPVELAARQAIVLVQASE